MKPQELARYNPSSTLPVASCHDIIQLVGFEDIKTANNLDDIRSGRKVIFHWNPKGYLEQHSQNSVAIAR